MVPLVVAPLPVVFPQAAWVHQCEFIYVRDLPIQYMKHIEGFFPPPTFAGSQRLPELPFGLQSPIESMTAMFMCYSNAGFSSISAF